MFKKPLRLEFHKTTHAQINMGGGGGGGGGGGSFDVTIFLDKPSRFSARKVAL